MRDDTPCHQIPLRNVVRNQACVHELVNILEPVTDIWEAFGGLGMCTEEYLLRFPRATIHATDIDARCVRTYNAKFDGRAVCYRRDALKYIRALHPSREWGAFLDFNQFTLHDVNRRTSWRSELMDEVVQRKPRWIVLADSAVHYLHLNWSHYGAADATLGAYIRVMRKALRSRWGLRILDYAHHHAAAYLALAPHDRPHTQQATPQKHTLRASAGGGLYPAVGREPAQRTALVGPVG